jgi:primosomal protein N' (replication factor Y)
VTDRVVRVLPDEAAIDKTFDYLVPDALGDHVRVGTVVRVELHGRRVGGWVVEDDVEPPPGVTLRPIAKVTGWGPPPDVVDLASWAAWRWAGRRASLLGSATADRAVPALPRPDRAPVASAVIGDELAERALRAPRPGCVLRLPPATDPYPVALAAAVRGPALIIFPSVIAAQHAGRRLARAGIPVAVVPRDWAKARAGAVTVVGARAAAWAPVRDLSAVVVVDEHDETHQEERTPTWHARDVAIERARRARVPCVLVSPCPSLEALGWGRLLTPSRAEERDGWPALQVVDGRRDEPGRAGLFSESFVAAARRARSVGPVVCVLNRTGRARLLLCRSCGEVARCERCDAAVVEESAGVLSCKRCGTERPLVCLQCGGAAFRRPRLGVSRAREELAALLGEEVTEVTGAQAGEALAPVGVYIGTEAVLHQVRAAALVAFLDFDQELLAPRYRAAEEALALIARAGRLVGGRRSAGRVLVQTRLPEHPVIRAALTADPARLAHAEADRRRTLRWPPYAALAEVSGAAAESYIERLGAPLGVEVRGPDDGRWLLRAPDHQLLCDALAGVERPPSSAGRLRIAVDPLRV